MNYTRYTPLCPNCKKDTLDHSDTVHWYVCETCKTETFRDDAIYAPVKKSKTVPIKHKHGIIHGKVDRITPYGIWIQYKLTKERDDGNIGKTIHKFSRYYDHGDYKNLFP